MCGYILQILPNIIFALKQETGNKIKQNKIITLITKLYFEKIKL